MALPRHHGEDVSPDSFRVSAAAGSATVVDAGGRAPVMLPSGRFASDAEYLQQGDDLLLLGPDGTMVVVRDYFLTDSPPDLLTPEGGRITPAIVDAFTPPESAGQYAQAGSSATEAIGQISTVAGKVIVIRTNGVREEIGAGDPIFQGDVIETADGASVDILFIDKTTFALGGDARLAIDKLVYDPDTNEGSSSYSILKGMFVFSSGEIAKFNPLDMTVKTTVATIGIRGTTVVGEVLPAGEQSKFTIIEGEIIVLTDAGYVILSEANETTFVTGFNAPPSEAVLFSGGEIDGFYGNVKGISDDYYDPDSTQGPSGNGNENGSGEGGEPDLEQLAEVLFDLAPAAGGEGSSEGEGGLLGNEVTLLRVDQNPFRTEAGQQFNLTENAGDEQGGGDGDDGDTGGGGDAGGGGTSTPGIFVEEGGSAGGVGGGVAVPDGVLLFDFSNSDIAVNFVGTDGDDKLVGSSFDDTLKGGGGNDTIEGGLGNDMIVSGSGNDNVDGGDGVDTLDFSAATEMVTVDLAAGRAEGVNTDTDTIVNIENVEGGAGDDTITGDDGDNSFSGGDGDDGIAGGGGDDVIDTGAGDDFATGGTGNDVILGGFGDDGIFGDDGNDIIDGGDGADGIDGGSGNDVLSGGAGDDNIVGAGGVDTVDGNAGRDTLDGGEGDDLLRGGDDDDVYRVTLGSGSDRIEDSGGDGDRIVVTGVSESLSEYGGTSRVGDDLVISLGNEQIVVADHFVGGTVETITFEFEDGSAQTFVLATGEVGDDENGILIGTNGIDTLSGEGGDDILIGNGSNDLLLGGDGNDTFLVSGLNDGFDTVNGGAGFDRILGGEEDDLIGLSRFTGDDTVEEIDGGAGENIIRGTSSRSVLDFSETTLTNIARIEGGGSNDTITGSSADDTILGSGGSDLQDGGGGDDAFLFVGSNIGFNRITGGTGFDRIVGGDEDDVIGLSNFAGSETVEQIDGGAGENVILGASNKSVFDFSETELIGISRIDGGGGKDTITGSSGNDTIAGGSGNDRMDGFDGDDVFLVSGSGNGFDRVTGGEGSDQILGSAGDDVIGLFRYSGDETVEAIDGGTGENVIQGTSGSSVFDFSQTQLTNIDLIDGRGGNDRITGSAGGDTISGGAGNDEMDGGDGDDVFLVAGSGGGFDEVTGGEGSDLILGGSGDDDIGLSSFVGDQTVEEIDGGGGENVIVGASNKTVLDFSETVLTNIARNEGRGGNDTITGSSGDDTVLGGAGNDRLIGGDGDDLLDAGAGKDRLFGDAGDDRLVVENDNFLLIDGGADIDTIVVDFTLDLTNVADTKIENIERFDLRSGSDAVLTIGLDDVLPATSGINALTGGEDDLVIRRDAGDAVNVVGDSWETSQESIDTDDDGGVEGYTVFNDVATGATVYVENVQVA